MVNQPIGNHGLGIFWCGRIWPWAPPFKVKQGQPNLKGFITRLLLILEVCNVKPTCRILWAGNLLMSDVAFGPSFKVKRWFTGFGELSFWWIQICICSPMRRSSFNMLFTSFLVSYNIVKLQTCSSLHSWAKTTLRFSLLSKSIVTRKLLHLQNFV